MTGIQGNPQEPGQSSFQTCLQHVLVEQLPVWKWRGSKAQFLCWQGMGERMESVTILRLGNNYQSCTSLFVTGVSHGVSPPDSGQAEEAEEAVYVSLHLPQLLPLNQLYLWKIFLSITNP